MSTFTTKCDRCGRTATVTAATPGEALEAIRLSEPPCWQSGAEPDQPHLWVWPWLAERGELVLAK